MERIPYFYSFFLAKLWKFLLTQLVGIILCFLVFTTIYIFYTSSTFPFFNEYQSTECFVLAKKIGKKPDFYPIYRTRFLVSYAAEGAYYQRWIDTRTQQREIAKAFRVGQHYTCYTVADHPEQVTLKPNTINLLF